MPVLLFAVFLAGAGPALDAQALQGTWQVVAVEAQGKKYTDKDPELAPFKELRITFKGDKVSGPAGEEFANPFVLKAAGKTKVIELTAGETNGQELIHRALYEVNGDTLRLCTRRGRLNAEPPKAFAGTDETIIFTFRRVKP
jgi:uncharacterized protein (TIGR03067 family)